METQESVRLDALTDSDIDQIVAGLERKMAGAPVLRTMRRHQEHIAELREWQRSWETPAARATSLRVSVGFTSADFCGSDFLPGAALRVATADAPEKVHKALATLAGMAH